jgi:hypothetical protein
VAFAAGAMALVTQFPWGQRREGIGGALAKDVNAEDIVRVVPRPTMKDPPPRSGERPLAQPVRSSEPVEPPAPASPSRIADKVSLVGGGVTEDVEGLLVHRVLRDPSLRTAEDETAEGKDLPVGWKNNDGAGSFGGRGGVDLPVIPEGLRGLLPSSFIDEIDADFPLFSSPFLEFGEQETWRLGGAANEHVSMSPSKLQLKLFGASLQMSWDSKSFGVKVQTPEKHFTLDEEGTTISIRQSGTMLVMWDGWDTQSRVEYNTADYIVESGPERGNLIGTGSHGVYFEDKPYQVLAYTELLRIAVGVVAIAPQTFAALKAVLGRSPIPSPYGP